MASTALAGTPDEMSRHDKKKHKKDKSERKRAREEGDAAAADGERKHKKSKSVTAAEDVVIPDSQPVEANGEEEEKKKKKKDRKKHRDENEEAESRSERKHKKKHKHRHADGESEPQEDAVEPTDEKIDRDESDKKHKKKKRSKDTDPSCDKAERREKKKKSKKHHVDEDEQMAEAAPEAEAEVAESPVEESSAEAEAMDVDNTVSKSPKKPSKIYQPPGIPKNPQFPFFTQTISLYEPIYPIGWAQPVTNSEYQHLKPLQNKYVPSLRGVLLDYRNVTIGEKPGRAGAAKSDDDSTTLVSQNEYAVGFGWITADVDLFVPSRGAWMEGSVNLQTEGHIGVVCFGKFNASIEARRLPSDWEWVANESSDAQGFEETASLITADEHGVVRQIHSTGFWTDGDGEKVKGKIRFRIRNFDVGVSGDTSYLSLEGTMLDKAGEKEVVAEEARLAQNRKGGRAGLAARRDRKRIPDFSMTRFETQEEDQEAPAPDTEEGKLEDWKSAQPEVDEAEAQAEAEPDNEDTAEAKEVSEQEYDDE